MRIIILYLTSLHYIIIPGVIFKQRPGLVAYNTYNR